MPDIEFSPAVYRRGADGMEQTAQSLQATLGGHLAAVGDVSALGNRDILGAFASLIYQSVLERFAECAGGVGAGFSGHGELLHRAADLYERTETQATHDATTMIEGGL